MGLKTDQINDMKVFKWKIKLLYLFLTYAPRYDNTELFLRRRRVTLRKLALLAYSSVKFKYFPSPIFLAYFPDIPDF